MQAQRRRLHFSPDELHPAPAVLMFGSLQCHLGAIEDNLSDGTDRQRTLRCAAGAWIRFSSGHASGKLLRQQQRLDAVELCRPGPQTGSIPRRRRSTLLRVLPSPRTEHPAESYAKRVLNKFKKQHDLHCTRTTVAFK